MRRALATCLTELQVVHANADANRRSRTYPPATEAQIRAAERRLNFRFPVGKKLLAALAKDRQP